jgi:catechol 2,3-dioxygenase-like lactoylglutathione lyase family enzyme
MLKVDSFVLYVEDIDISRKFYSDIFECEGVVLSPTFVSFPFGGALIELKQRAQALPPTQTTGGGTELSLSVEDPKTLRIIYELWEAKKVKLIQDLTELVFGITFVAVDPDGHRIRVFTQRIVLS